MEFFQDEREFLGTTIFVELGTNSEEVAQDLVTLVWAEVERIEQQYSRFLSDSALSKLNQNLNEWQEVDDEFFELLQSAHTLKTKTNGAFDITIKSILDSWGYDATYSLRPKESSGQVGEVELDIDEKKVKLGAEIDFGGLGKGFFLDQVKFILEQKNCSNYFINAGGDIVISGKNSAGEFWEIFFENPMDVTQVIGKASLSHGFVGASSSARRQWGEHHHLVDGQVEKPAQASLAVFTQSSESGLEADAYSTALFVMGYKVAQGFLTSPKKLKGLEAMLVAPNGEIWRTPKFQGDLFKV
jgi:thiamine biosynthesis lipoprotein